MAAKSNNVKIGIFVIIAILLLIAGVLAFGAKSYFTPKTYFETAIVGEVSGLSVGSGVQFRGVPIGKVSRIAMVWNDYPKSQKNYIIVDFEVDGDLLPLPPGVNVKDAVKRGTEHGLRAIVKGQGITGTSILAIESVTPPPPEAELDYSPRHVYIPSTPGQFSRMLESIETSLENVQRLDFAAIGQGITNALGGVRLLADKLDKLDLHNIATNASSLLVQGRSAAVKAEETLSEIRQSIKGMKLDNVSQHADALLTDLRETSARLQTLLARLNSVPMQDAVLDLEQTLNTLTEVLVDLKRYPSGFLLGGPPPPVKGVQPPKP